MHVVKSLQAVPRFRSPPPADRGGLSSSCELRNFSRHRTLVPKSLGVDGRDVQLLETLSCSAAWCDDPGGHSRHQYPAKR
jgi:hypothetical protein